MIFFSIFFLIYFIELIFFKFGVMNFFIFLYNNIFYKFNVIMNQKYFLLFTDYEHIISSNKFKNNLNVFQKKIYPIKLSISLLTILNNLFSIFVFLILVFNFLTSSQKLSISSSEFHSIIFF